MPVFNEEKTVQHAIQNILKRRSVFELVVVNDGSTDKTGQIVNKLAKNIPQTTCLPQEEWRQRLSSSIRFKKSQGRLRFDSGCWFGVWPRWYCKLLEPIKKKKAVVVYGSRFLGPHSNLLFWHMMGNRFLNFTLNILYNTTLSDLETCYKLAPTQIWKQCKIQANDFGIEPEVTCKILKMGIRIYETPISYVGRDFSEGKKITWQHGFGAFWTIVKLRFF